MRDNREEKLRVEKGARRTFHIAVPANFSPGRLLRVSVE